jgi:hypothetical protein
MDLGRKQKDPEAWEHMKQQKKDAHVLYGWEEQSREDCRRRAKTGPEDGAKSNLVF